MNRLIRTGLGALALLLVGGAAAAQGAPRMVYVNTQRVMAEAPGIQAARETMRQELTEMEKEIAPLRTEYESMVAQYQQQQGVMTPERRSEQQQALGLKQQEIQQKAAELEQQAQTRQQELLQPQLIRINQVIEQLREERGYAFIFDVAAGGVLAADPALDITGEVLQRLQGVASQ